MIRLSKLADYAMVIMTHFAKRPEQQSAMQVADATQIPQPTASKLLKALARASLLQSHRGARGGYFLDRPAGAIKVAAVIEAIDGPIALTACVDESDERCEIENTCPARANWVRINGAIKSALDDISVADMAHAIPPAFLTPEERDAERASMMLAERGAAGAPR